MKELINRDERANLNNVETISGDSDSGREETKGSTKGGDGKGIHIFHRSRASTDTD